MIRSLDERTRALALAVCMFLIIALKIRNLNYVNELINLIYTHTLTHLYVRVELIYTAFAPPTPLCRRH